MALQIYIDGKYYPEGQAKVSVFDHGLLYGDGVFEGMRCYAGKVFRHKEHIDRLYDSAKAIWLEIPMTKRAMTRAVEATLKRNKLRDAYIRLIVTRGVGDLGLDPRKCPVPSVIIIAASIQLYPPSFYTRGLDIVTAASPRIAPESLSPRVKSLNYLNNILAKIEGIQAGCVEVLMLNHLGYVCECSGDNIFAVKGKRITTPPSSAGILKGITRDAVMELARKARCEVVEADLTRYDLYTADEVFLTGSAAEIIGVVKIDGREIGNGRPGPVTGDLLARFRRLAGLSRAGAKKGKPAKTSKKTAQSPRRRRR